ncbi:unnamed protein product, partial [Prorocentrum cordatum]
EETLAIQVQEFLDGWEFRIMRSSLGKAWKRDKAISTALDLMAVNGVPLSRDEIDFMSRADERTLVGLLTDKIPPTMWDNFEILTTELTVMLNTMCRVRTALDEEDESVAQIIEETAESDTMVQRIVKESVVLASREAACLAERGAAWRASMDKRLERLESSARYAEYARQQLMAVENQLGTITASQSSKNKSALMGLAQGNDRALLKSTLSSWLGVTLGSKADREVRQRYERELKDSEDALFAFMEKRLVGVKDALMRKVRESDRGLVDLCISSWYDVIQLSKKEGDTKKAMEEMEARMRDFQGEQKARQMRFVGRMLEENSQAALLLAWQTWQAFHRDYAKDKEIEEASKKLEQQMAAHMKSKKDDAKKVLDRMGGATDTGLMTQVWRCWLVVVAEGRKSKDIEKLMEEQDVRLKLMLTNQKGFATQAQMRTNEQMNQNLILRVLGAWMLETKVTHVEKRYREKIDSKRDQLRKVQTLFTRFAKELEDGLTPADGESSGRTQKGRSKQQRGVDGSLPGIRGAHSRS